MARGIYPRPSLEDRFWSKVEKTDNCWMWRGAKLSNGYGQFGYNGKCLTAHRLAYQLLIGEIPRGLTIDHLCRNTICVNPAHLEPVTQRENNLRGLTGFNQATKTHCPQGHEYNMENTYVDLEGYRHCRVCKRERQRRYMEKK